MQMGGWAWRVVLVRPRNPLNIGAAARAMANFGLEDLVVVAPYEPVWREARSAAGAEQVLNSARAAESLRAAVGDCERVVGTTTGCRRHLDRDLMSLRDFAAWLRKQRAGGRAALLFGSEKTGLSNEHPSYCHALLRIPTASACPSMNLGQAVAVCCYELARSGAVPMSAAAPRVFHSGAAAVESLERLLDRAVRVLEASGYFAPRSRRAQILRLRRFLFDLRLSNYEARILGAVLAQIEWKIGLPKS